MPRPPEKIEIDTFFPRNNFQLFAAGWNESTAQWMPKYKTLLLPQQEDCCSNISTTQYSLTIVSILDQNWFRALHFHRILSGSRVYLSDSLTWKGFVPRFNIDSTSISPVMKFECLQKRNRFGWNVQFPLFWIPQLGWTATHGFPMNFLFASLNCLLQLTQIYWDMHLKNLWMNIRIFNYILNTALDG